MRRERPTSEIERLPPHSIEAEQSVLGCIMLDPRTALPQVIEMFGGPEAFYDGRHQMIFEAMVQLADANIPIDLVSMSEKLKSKNQLEPCGGITYIAVLPDAAPSASGVEYFAQLVEEKAALRRMIHACTAAVSRIYEGEHDTEELIAQAEKEVLAVRRQRHEKTPGMRALVHDAIEEIERLHQAQGSISGLGTGFKELDRLTDGLHGGEMVVVAAFPGGGKTALAVGISEQLAVECKLPVGIFSLEMKAKRLVMRMLASRARINMRNVRDGFLCESDFSKMTSAAGQLANAPIHFSDMSDMNISQLRAKARQMAQQHGVKMIVVDYLQLLSGQSHRKDQNREQEVSAISRGIKQMATEFNIPVLALSQLNEDGKLRESRAIGQDADSIWILNPNGEEEQSHHAVKVTLKITKQRDGQSPAQVGLTFLKAYTRFESEEKVTAEDAQYSMPYQQS